MSKLTIRLIQIFTVLLIGFFSVTGWSCYGETQGVQVELPSDRWEPLYFKEIDQVTRLAGIEELRKTKLKKEDLEVRVWRGFGLSPLEGVLLMLRDGQWSARHVKADAYLKPERAEIRELSPPKSGWHMFWNLLLDKRLLTLPDASGLDCQKGGYDGIGYVVEINKNHTYRTYMYDAGKCSEARLMEEIGEIIGLEFDTGQEPCKTTEWFPCMTLRKSR
jgi:hypothetical protein